MKIRISMAKDRNAPKKTEIHKSSRDTTLLSIQPERSGDKRVIKDRGMGARSYCWKRSKIHDGKMTDCGRCPCRRRSRSCSDRRTIRPCSGRLPPQDTAAATAPCTRRRLQNTPVRPPSAALNRYFIDTRRPIPPAHFYVLADCRLTSIGKRALLKVTNF